MPFSNVTHSALAFMIYDKRHATRCVAAIAKDINTRNGPRKKVAPANTVGPGPETLQQPVE